MTVRRLIGIVRFHVTGGDPPPRIGEAMASRACYPTTGRRVIATPKNSPGDADSAPGPTGGSVSRGNT